MTADEDLRELFRAEKAMQPPLAAAERGWSRLAADLAANVAPMSIGVGAFKSGLWLVPKWILAGLAVGFVGVGVVSWVSTPNAVAVSAPVAVVRVDRAASSAPAAAEKAQVEIDPVPVTALPSPHTESGNASAVAAPAVSVSPTFDAEMQLISRAKAQLDTRQFALARSTLDEHAVEFPGGVFATERDALRVLVTCTQGPKNAALVEKFAAQHPGSPLTERLERACSGAAAPSASAPAPGAIGDFSKWQNGAPAPGERMAEPSTGAQR